jgi:hypothetical protein
MEVTRAELDRRLRSGGNLANAIPAPSLVVTEKPKREYTPQIKDTNVRALAGSLAQIDSPTHISAEFGLTKQQIRSAANSPKEPIRNAVQETCDRVSELALNRLMGVLGLLTPDTMVGEKPKDLAAIAASLSKVTSNMRPRDINPGSGMQVLIYAPPQKTERSYEVLDI